MRTNAAQIAQRFQRRARRVTPELSVAARRLAPILNAEAKKVMQAKIYSIPIPMRGRSPLWQRTGLLKRSETARAEGPVVILANSAGYAVWRYVLGLPGHRQPRYTLSVQWHKTAIEQQRKRIVQERRDAILRALRG